MLYIHIVEDGRLTKMIVAPHLDGEEHLLPVPGMPRRRLDAHPARELAALKKNKKHGVIHIASRERVGGHAHEQNSACKRDQDNQKEET